MGKVQTSTTAKGAILKRKEIVIIDDTKSKISLILWDTPQIDNFEGTVNDSIILKNVKVFDYYGVKNLGHPSITLINSNIEEAKRLTQWYDKTVKKQNDDIYIQISREQEEGFNFVKFNMIYNKEKITNIDVIAKIGQIKETENITSVHGDNYEKKEIILINENNRKITLNLWNEKINEFKGKKGDIIAIKNAKIGEYNHIKNLYLINSSRISINPGVPEATKIREECQEQNQDTELDETMYTKIEKILNLVNQTIINVIAVIEYIGDTDIVFAKDGREFIKREIKLIDNSDEITLTLWNENAENCIAEKDKIIKIDKRELTNINLTNI